MNVLADHRMWFGLHDSTDGFSRGGAWKRISCMRESDDDKWSNYSSIEMPRVKTMGLTYVYVCDM